jgi:hypothetical protein
MADYKYDNKITESWLGRSKSVPIKVDELPNHLDDAYQPPKDYNFIQLTLNRPSHRRRFIDNGKWWNKTTINIRIIGPWSYLKVFWFYAEN